MQLPTDVRYAIRLFSRAPGFTLAVIVVTALGIGANSAIFTALDNTVIRPLPYTDPERLAMLWEDFSVYGLPKNRVSPGTFFDWRKRTQVFESLAAYGGRNINLTGGGAPEEVLGQAVTANLFPLLGVPPLLGRTFTGDEEGPGVRATLLSYGLWQRRFGGAPKLVGNTILLNGEKYTVIGVMPPGFHYPNRHTELWLPLGLQPEILSRRNSHFLNVIGRFRPGRNIQQAQSDMTAVGRQLAAEFSQTNAKVGVTVVPLKEEFLGDTRTAFLILISAAGCVLLIACANVGNLLLARASGRRQEIAVRTALGAAPLRIVRQILTENLVLAGAGGALGLLFTHWSMASLQKMIPAGFATSSGLHLDFRVVAFAATLSILTSLLFGLAPALQLLRTGAYNSIKVTGQGTLGHGRKLRDLLVIAEIAIALVLVVGAGLLIETLIRLRAVNPGFRSEGILTADIPAPLPKYQDSGKRRRFYNEVLSRVRSIPGVRAAGLTSDLPYTTRGNTMGLAIEGKPAQFLGQDALFRLVSDGYLQTIGARLREGRFLQPSDREDSIPVVVVNETLARRFWPNEGALGHRIDTGTGDGTPRWMTIVGVVGDIRERGLDLAMKPAVYVPFTQTEITFFQPSEIAVLASREPLHLSKPLQQAVWTVEPEQPVSHIRTMDEIVDDELASRTQVLQLLGAFAALALLLAALGIYGVLSYVVSQRTREIGLRMAIGASHRDIVRAILAYTARLTSTGLAAGIVAAVAGTRLLSTLLFGVSPLDPKTFVAVSALLAIVALLASYVPARRAAAVDPAVALRQDG